MKTSEDFWRALIGFILVFLLFILATIFQSFEVYY